MHRQNCRDLIARYRRDLEAQLQRQDVRQKIEWLREAYRVFARYPSVAELASLVQQRSPRFYADKDAVLTALVIEVQRSRTLFPLLNLMFWDSLMSIFRRKRRDCLNPDDLFSRIQDEFFEVAVTYPLDRRPRKVDANLYLDTWKKITAWQQEEAKHREPCRPLGSADDILVDPRETEVHPKDMEVYEKLKPLEPADEAHIILGDLRQAEIHPEDIEGHLLDYVHQRVISEMQLGLLLETEVYKRMTPKQWAEAHGVPHATARCWRHRAEKAIRKYEKERRR